MNRAKIELSDEVVEHVIILAAEGASDYWSNADWDDEDESSVTIVFVDPDTDLVRKEHLDRAALNRGANIILNTPHFADGIRDIRNALFDAHYLDWDVADAIVQASIFGQLVFS